MGKDEFIRSRLIGLAIMLAPWAAGLWYGFFRLTVSIFRWVWRDMQGDATSRAGKPPGQWNLPNSTSERE